ncbi:hypothetical protein [Spirochaeta dissipatitropha]
MIIRRISEGKKEILNGKIKYTHYASKPVMKIILRRKLQDGELKIKNGEKKLQRAILLLLFFIALLFISIITGLWLIRI